VSHRLACLALIALALTSVVRWWTTLSRVAGGADSYGYVSESQLILRGSLIQRPPEIAHLPLARPDALAVAAPLGYLGSIAADGIVPIYPVGLPVMMAAATVIAGPEGPFYVAPVMGLAGLWLVYAVARVWFDALTSCLAVAFVAWSPLYVAYAKQPMSDVPAAVVLMTSIWLLVRTPCRPAAAGVAAALALLTRPALLGGGALLVLLAAWRDGWRGASRYGAVFAFAMLAQMGIHWVFYGHPLQSGYGSPRTLFAWSMLPTNLLIYGRWLLLSHGFVWTAAVVLGLLLARPRWLSGPVHQYGPHRGRRGVRPPRRGEGEYRAYSTDEQRRGTGAPNACFPTRWGGGSGCIGGRMRPYLCIGPLSLGAIALLVAVALPYLLYFEFDHWETLRFVLPGLMALTVVGAAGVTTALEKTGRRNIAAIVVVISAAALAFESNRWLERQGAWRLAILEEKYPLVARWIAESTPSSAMVMAFQHSGSIRHYAGRFTLRWDRLRADDLIPTVRRLNAQGIDVYAVFEGEELEQFQERFRDVLDDIELLPAGQARGVIVVELQVSRGGPGL
jgi:hypothetical protein